MNEDNECNNDSESIELERERSKHVYKQIWTDKKLTHEVPLLVFK